MDQHLKSGNLTNLCVSFSRDQQAEDAPRYVQDNIRRHGEALVKLIEDNGAVIYVCGDAKNMAKDVNQAFVDVFSTVKGLWNCFLSRGTVKGTNWHLCSLISLCCPHIMNHWDIGYP